jgi:hypothetical protein
LAELLQRMSNDGPTLGLRSDSVQTGIRRTQTSLERHSFLGEKTNWVPLVTQNPVVNIDCGNLDQSQLQLVVGATLRELQYLRKQKQIRPSTYLMRLTF